VTYAGWGQKKIIDEIRSLVEKLQKQLIEMRLSTSLPCYKAACRYAQSLERIIRCRCLAYEPSAQVDVDLEDLDGLRSARSEFFAACRVDLGVERKRLLLRKRGW
jgi:hypothetical protein